MKKLYFFLTIMISSFIFATNIHAQCTPDPDCTDPEGDGEYCPGQLPNAVEDEYYDQTLTIIAPSEQGGFELHHADVVSIENIPPGMNFQCQDDNCTFYPATPKCINIYGTPEVDSWGFYKLTVTVDIYLNIGGVPVFFGQMSDSSSFVYIEPKMHGDFEINYTDNWMCKWETYTVTYTGNATSAATYNWTFPENIDVISGENEGPYEVIYQNDFIGMDSISLSVEEGIYTSPVYSNSYYVAVCEGIEEVNNNTFTFQPNPANDFIDISGLRSAWALVQIYDLSGKEIWSGNIDQQNSMIDISHLRKGIYLISISNSTQVTTQKMVKQ